MTKAVTEYSNLKAIVYKLQAKVLMSREKQEQSENETMSEKNTARAKKYK